MMMMMMMMMITTAIIHGQGRACNTQGADEKCTRNFNVK
jgi:hypothetical protein